MRFEILGPLRCGSGRPAVDLSRRREGRILAALLLSANRTVPMDGLIDMLWGERPPATARQQVQNCVSSVVRRLRGTDADLFVVRTASGYLLEAVESDLDAAVFETEVARARSLAGTGDRAAAAQLLRTALGRWRGRVLAGIDLGPFTPAAVRLEELRLTAMEQRFDLEMELGRGNEILADLAEAVGTHPVRERIVGQFMLALAGSGRTAEALEVFRDTRRVLRDSIAVEPSRDLHAVQVAILQGTSDAGLDAEAATAQTQHQLLMTAVAAAERARRRLELVLLGARELTVTGHRDPQADSPHA
jgi:DNA-binding SARP family transcriptional activator